MAALIKASWAEHEMEKLGRITFLAVRDEYFPNKLFYELVKNATLRTEVLNYHIVSGTHRIEDMTNDAELTTFDEKLTVRTNVYKRRWERYPTVTVNGARILQPNIKVFLKSGLIHTTDRLLYPIPRESIIDVISQQSNFSTLMYAITKASIRSELEGSPHTLFAPTNAAFQAMAPGTYSELLNNKTALVDVLTYHVVKGTLFKAGIHNGDKARALDDKELSFSFKRGTIKVDKTATITSSDVPIKDGVIHVVDQVLMPPE